MLKNGVDLHQAVFNKLANALKGACWMWGRE